MPKRVFQVVAKDDGKARGKIYNALGHLKASSNFGENDYWNATYEVVEYELIEVGRISMKDVKTRINTRGKHNR